MNIFPVAPISYLKEFSHLPYLDLHESLYTPDIWIEINYVLEDNAPMNNAIHKLNAKPLRRYRVFEREI